ncbi:MAG: FAD-binding protein [Desulfobacterales bacterium]|nr:FAD-binding protein [Desulfobacterales bacterium]
MGFSGSTYRKLSAIVGPDHITRSKEDLLCYSYDATGRSFLPQVIVFPKTSREIAEIFKLASRKKIPVIPRGSGSGMTGGAVPVQGGIVLVTSRMDQILEIDTENLIARVEPGVILADIHSAVEAEGLFYPPDPASSAVCSIGGNVAECAGGPKAVKYGVTRDYILGLTAVTPTGEIIKTGVATAKGVAGYDLTRLIVGSEGTLCVVTEITLRLIAKPEAVKTMAAYFDSMDLAAKTISTLMGKGVRPRCVEYLDHACIDLLQTHRSLPMPEGVKALVILELDGDPEMVEKEAETVDGICRDIGALEVRTASSSQESVKLWEARKALSPIMHKLAPNKINEDIVVPISKIPEMVEIIAGLRKSSGLNIASFGHAGDGNIHCNIMYEKSDEDQSRRAHKAVDQLFAETLRLGGTITGEHGVGITKMPYLALEIGETERRIMKGIKSVFDPDNILNPGKIFF